MINLGLSRIRALLALLGNPQNQFKVFHVAGTNGKGSVCTYIESVLEAKGLVTGKFTSPHLIRPNDAVRVRQRDLDPGEYGDLLESIRSTSLRHDVGATEFEIQTALAFSAFKNHNIEVGVVEVGLGGLEDATNVLSTGSILCSAITKIAVDHESFLGSTLESVARHKAGIMRPDRPCVVDGSNDQSAMGVFWAQASLVGADIVVTQPRSSDYQQQNLAVALTAVKRVYPDLSQEVIEAGVRSAHWPGRMQWVNESTLVDGAHNPSAAVELRRYLDTLDVPVRLVVAFSKPAEEILSRLLRPSDEVVVTSFGAVEGMPWIQPQPMDEVAAIARKYSAAGATTVSSIAELEPEFAGITVVCGSLYLVGEYLKLMRS